MIRAASLPIEINLLRLSQYLQSQGIAHRIHEESGQQVIWVESEAQALFVKQSLDTWSFDEDDKHSTGIEAANSLSGSAKKTHSFVTSFLLKLAKSFRSTPVSFALIVGCLIVAVISELGVHAQRVAWLFYPLLSSDSLLSLLADISSLEILVRSFTPMFLHFGELHLIFNMLWLWYFGKQLEGTHPRLLFVALILLTSFVGNTSQYLYSHYNNFGGMSGVIYGLVGYAWLTHRYMPKSYLLINNSMFIIFVVALVAMELLASSMIASAAHMGGLVAGLLFGLCTVLIYRFVLGRDAINVTRG